MLEMCNEKLDIFVFIRGFGFVTFADDATVNKVLGDPKHVINGKVVSDLSYLL